MNAIAVRLLIGAALALSVLMPAPAHAAEPPTDTAAVLAGTAAAPAESGGAPDAVAPGAAPPLAEEELPADTALDPADPGTEVPSAVPGDTEPEPATLVLRPVCSEGDRHRFAVDSTSGPGVDVTVGVDGVVGTQPVRVDAGATVYFWVDDAALEQVTIGWDGGSATATPARRPCAYYSAGATPDAPPAAPAPAPERGTNGTGAAAPSDQPSAGASASTGPGRPDASQNAAPPAESSSAAPSERSTRATAPRTASTPDPRDATTPPASDADSADAAPRPQPSEGGFACPDGWIGVDSDGDGGVDASDACEVMVATSADGPASPNTWTTVTLGITIALLLASIIFGLVVRKPS